MDTMVKIDTNSPRIYLIRGEFVWPLAKV